MKTFVRQAKTAEVYRPFMLAAVGSVAMLLSDAAIAQVAGGSEAGVGPPQWSGGSRFDENPTEPVRCIHRAIDLRRSSNLDDNRLTVWLSVHQPTNAIVSANGSASGQGTGSIAISLTRDGVPVGNSPENRGSSFISANASATVKLLPGPQYKITARPTVINKRLDLFDMNVGVGKACP